MFYHNVWINYALLEYVCTYFYTVELNIEEKVTFKESKKLHNLKLQNLTSQFPIKHHDIFINLTKAVKL